MDEEPLAVMVRGRVVVVVVQVVVVMVGVVVAGRVGRAGGIAGRGRGNRRRTTEDTGGGGAAGGLTAELADLYFAPVVDFVEGEALGLAFGGELRRLMEKNVL